MDGDFFLLIGIGFAAQIIDGTQPRLPRNGALKPPNLL